MMEETFANFISGSIITMVSMMVLSAGLLKTNILSHIVNLTTRARGGGIHLLLALADATGVPHTSLILPASIGAQLGIGLFPVSGFLFTLDKSTVIGKEIKSYGHEL